MDEYKNLRSYSDPPEPLFTEDEAAAAEQILKALDGLRCNDALDLLGKCCDAVRQCRFTYKAD